MALIIEDGTGVTGANAYISLVEFRQFAADRFVNVSAYDDDVTSGSIVTASVDFISVYYNFLGGALTTTQGMQLPTDEVLINSSVKSATYQATLLNLQGKLFVDSSDINVSGAIKRTFKKADVLEKEIEYQENTGYTSKYPTISIDRILRPFLSGGGNLPKVLA